MKRIVLALSAILCCMSLCQAQSNVTTVLDKCAATVSAKEGVSAQFTMESAQFGNTSGTIDVKGTKFHAATPLATMWFDGKTQWTYLKKNEEVSITTPTEAQLQALNPYNFINMYKQGYNYTMNTSDTVYEVHLTAQDAQRKVQELFITILKSDYTPSKVRMRQGTRWTTFVIKNLKKTPLADGVFQFNTKDYPSAEVIDLR